MGSVFLCNDLTPRVLDEALASGAGMIITYHPTPFGKFKKVTALSLLTHSRRRRRRRRRRHRRYQPG